MGEQVSVGGGGLEDLTALRESVERLTDDPDCVEKVADDPSPAEMQDELKREMETALRVESDLHMFGYGNTLNALR